MVYYYLITSDLKKVLGNKTRSVQSSLGNNYNYDCISQHLVRPLSTGTQSTIDPTARRPNKICDPYGLQGKPLGLNEAQQQLSILDDGWRLGSDELAEMQQPTFLEKEYLHRSYLEGSKFISKLAAVAHNNNHFFSMKLERRLMRREKNWKFVTRVRCHTEVLGGLSFHDFHIAMLIDVEVARDDVKKLVILESQKSK